MSGKQESNSDRRGQSHKRKHHSKEAPVEKKTESSASDLISRDANDPKLRTRIRKYLEENKNQVRTKYGQSKLKSYII